VSPRKVSTQELRQSLRAQGAVLEESDCPARLETPPDFEMAPETLEL